MYIVNVRRPTMDLQGVVCELAQCVCGVHMAQIQTILILLKPIFMDVLDRELFYT